MKALKQLQRFNQLVDTLGSPYAATNYLARLARKLLVDNDNRLLESEAITWALTGEKPKLHRKRADYSLPSMEIVDEVLCYVDDEDVCESVKDSYNKSLQAKHLIYCYSHELTEYQRSRVRILMRMIWYNIQV